MAKMSDLAIEVEEMIRAGNTVDDIVDALGVPFEWVLEVGEWIDLSAVGVWIDLTEEA